MPSGEHHPILTPLPGGEAAVLSEAGPRGPDDLGLVDALAQLSFVVQGALGRIAASHDLSLVQTRLLGILRDRKPTITDLAAYLQLDKSSVTGLVDRAQERGLVTRTASTRDRRSVQVSLTPVGQAVIREAHDAFQTEMTRLMADLDTGQRRRLSTIASLVVTTDARRRGIDLIERGAATT